MSVSAKDLETGQLQSITVTATSGLSPEEIEAMIRENEDHLVAQKNVAEVEAEKVETQRALLEIERIYDQVHNLLSTQVWSRCTEKAKTVVDRAKVAMNGDDLEELRRLIRISNALMRCLKPSCKKSVNVDDVRWAPRRANCPLT